MANKNDNAVLKLKKQVAEKKAALVKSAKFVPVTNCSIELMEGKRYNIHTLQKESIIGLLVLLNAYQNSAKELDLLDSYMICGYNISEWITDLKAKLANITRKDEEVKLKRLEDKLHALLSNDTKVALELADLQKEFDRDA